MKFNWSESVCIDEWNRITFDSSGDPIGLDLSASKLNMSIDDFCDFLVTTGPSLLSFNLSFNSALSGENCCFVSLDAPLVNTGLQVASKNKYIKYLTLN
jgi:hypothetical protein